MNELFVPFKEALALKEIGFNEVCINYYDKNGDLLSANQTKSKSRRIYDNCQWVNLPDDTFYLIQGVSCQVSDESEPLTKAPLFSQVFDWFVDKYNLSGDYRYWDTVHTMKYWKGYVTDLNNHGVCITEMTTDFRQARLDVINKMITFVKNK